MHPHWKDALGANAFACYTKACSDGSFYDRLQKKLKAKGKQDRELAQL